MLSVAVVGAYLSFGHGYFAFDVGTHIDIRMHFISQNNYSIKECCDEYYAVGLTCVGNMQGIL